MERFKLTVAIFVGLMQGYAMQIALTSIVPILILGLLNTGIGCYFYFSSIGKLKVQTVAVVSAPPAAVAVTVELTEEQKVENAKNVLANLEMFGRAKIADFDSKEKFYRIYCVKVAQCTKPRKRYTCELHFLTVQVT